MRRRFFLIPMVALFIFLYIVPVNLAPSYVPSAIPAEQTILSADTSYYVEHGRLSYLGAGVYSYSTSLGERNTWDGDSWEPYIVSGNSVYFAGMTLNVYDWYATLDQDSLEIVDDMRWEVQQNVNDKWRVLDLWDHSVLSAVESGSNVVIGQSMTDGFSSANVTYHLSNCDMLKVRVDFIPYTAGEYRFVWSLSGIQGDLQEYNTTLGFDEVQIGFDDLEELPFVYDWQVSDKKLDVVIGSVVLDANEHFVIDPSVNPVIGADIDDCWWRWDTDITWTKYIASSEIYVSTQIGVEAVDFGYQRFVIDIEKDKLILSANLTEYVSHDDVAGKTASIRRINETDVGTLEGDTTHPILNNDSYAEWPFDGVEPEWETNDVTQLVQNQVNLNDWVTGNYMGFGFSFNESQDPAKWFRFHDYSAGFGNLSYLNITYTDYAPPTTTTPTVTTNTESIFFHLFLSLQMWGYLGPLGLITIGYIVTSKEKNLGFLFFIVESIVIVTYLNLAATTPAYWWHAYIMLFGCMSTLMYSLWDRG